MAAEQKKPMKLVFGDPQAGMVRVTDAHGNEIPNVVSVDINKIVPGEIPVISIQMRAPELIIENYESDQPVEMKTKTVTGSIGKDKRSISVKK